MSVQRLTWDNGQFHRAGAASVHHVYCLSGLMGCKGADALQKELQQRGRRDSPRPAGPDTSLSPPEKRAAVRDIGRVRPECLPRLVSHRTLRFSFNCQLPSLIQLRHRETKRRVKHGTEEVVAEWQRLLDDGVVKNRADLARRVGVSRARITRALNHT